RDLGAEGVCGQVVDTARVDQQEVLPVPVGEELLAIARHARCLVHDGLPGLGQAVDERRLAHVRVADDRDSADDLRRLGVLRGVLGLAHRGGTACFGLPAACISASQAWSVWSRRSISADASRYPLAPFGSPSNRT